MLKILLAHKLRFVWASLFIFLLVLVRVFENYLFYDPFLNFYKSDFNSLPFPNYNSFYLFLGLLFRFGLNTLISLGLIYVLFKDVGMVKFSSILYVLLFVILIFSFYLIVNISGVDNKLLLFYIRRFLIQPIFVLLFIPAFYFQRVNK